MNKKGMSGGFIGVMVGLILLIAVLLPVAFEVIANITGTYAITGVTAIVLNLVPVGLAIAALLLAFNVFKGK